MEGNQLISPKLSKIHVSLTGIFPNRVLRSHQKLLEVVVFPDPLM
jgi:hypothetical protein